MWSIWARIKHLMSHISCAYHPSKWMVRIHQVRALVGPSIFAGSWHKIAEDSAQQISTGGLNPAQPYEGLCIPGNTHTATGLNRRLSHAGQSRATWKAGRFVSDPSLLRPLHTENGDYFHSKQLVLGESAKDEMFMFWTELFISEVGDIKPIL